MHSNDWSVCNDAAWGSGTSSPQRSLDSMSPGLPGTMILQNQANNHCITRVLSKDVPFALAFQTKNSR